MNIGVPQVLAHQGQTVGKGRFRLLIPGGSQNRDLPIRLQLARQHHHQRKQSQNHGRGTRDRQIAPLALAFHSQMLAHLFKGDLQRPAHHKPPDDFFRRRVDVGASKDLIAQLPFGVARDDIANPERSMPQFVPQGGSREDQHLFLSAAVPINFDTLPGGVCARSPRFGRKLSLAFAWRRTTVSWGHLSRRMIQRGIPIKAHHQSRILQAGADQSQFDSGVTAVHDQDLGLLRQPTIEQPRHGHQNIHRRFILPRSLARRDEFLFALARLATDVMAKDLRRLSFELWGAQRRQKRQGIDLRRPRQFDQDRHRKPLQPKALDSLLSTRSDRVAITTQFTDLLATPSFDCVVGGKDDGFAWRKDRDDQSEQNPGGSERAPARPIEHPMVVLKVFLPRETDDSQASCHSAFVALKQHTEQEYFGVLPSRLCKKGLKHYNQTQQFGRQRSHMEDFSGKRVFPKLTGSAVTFSKTKDQNWIKSSRSPAFRRMRRTLIHSVTPNACGLKVGL